MRRLSLAAVLVALVAGCQSTTEPAPPEVFMLMTIDGRALPTMRLSDSAIVLSESLVRNGQGLAIRATAVQGENAPRNTSVAYAYTRQGDVLTIGERVCSGGGSCALHAAEQGVITGGTLYLSAVPSKSSVSAPVLVYQRGANIY